MHRSRMALAVVALVGISLGAGACGRGEAHDDAAPPPSDDVETEVCTILQVPLDHMVEGHTFAQLLDLSATNKELSGTAAAVALLRTRYRDDLGPYEPVIAHLAEVGRIDAGERGSMPKVTSEVRASARRLDRALADGLCG